MSTAASSCGGEHGLNLESLLQQIIVLTPNIIDGALPLTEVEAFAKKLATTIQRYEVEDGNVRAQIYLALSHIVSSYGAQQIPFELNDDWLSPQFETYSKAKAALFSLLTEWLSCDRPIPLRYVFTYNQYLFRQNFDENASIFNFPV